MLGDPMHIVRPHTGANHTGKEKRKVRLAKMLGLAMVAAIAAMAFLGASSASAVNLCKSETMTEPCGSKYAIGTKITLSLASGTEAVLKASAGNVKCKKSAVTGKTTAETTIEKAEVLEGETETVTFEECKLGETKCTVTSAGKFKLLVLLDPANPGKQKYHIVVHLGEALVVCGGFINCKFGGKEILFGPFLGTSLPLTASVSQELERKEGIGFICGTTAFWEATYTLTAPTPAWVSMT